MDTKFIPSHLQIETVTGYCTSHCIMCTIDDWTRPKSIMSTEAFKKILMRFDHIKENIKFLTMHGYGEPLLDTGLHEKIAFAKEQGFHGTGFATNATELDAEWAEKLLTAGLDTIIISIDGLDKATHEGIRVGTNFDTICDNTKTFLAMRDKRGAKTRVLIRFIRQESNYDQWPAYKEYWDQFISPEKKDEVIRFDVHNFGAQKVNQNKLNTEHHKNFECNCMFNKFFVCSAAGDVGFCSGDVNCDFFDLGNVLETDPVEIYNGEMYTKYRNMMREGRVAELEHCNRCDVMLCRLNRTEPKYLEV